MLAFLAIRGILFLLGGVMVLAGLAALGLGGEAALTGLWLVVIGGFLLIVAVLERSRYRSEAAERAMDPPGPGGGETAGTIDPRFRPSGEAFVDPTTQRRMRVLVDPRTGERRYVAEDQART